MEVTAADILASQAQAARSTSGAREETISSQSELDQQAFLRIFLAQIEHQDPLDPDNTADLGPQLAQYSQLEQSLKMTGELEGVSAKLDEMLEAILGRSSGLDPIAMIGRAVEIDGNALTLGNTGTKQTLRIEVQNPTDQILIEAKDQFGNTVALASFTNENEEGKLLNMPSGTYELSFTDDSAVLRTPSGQQIPLQFFQMTENEQGRQVADQNAPFGVPPASGVILTFGVTANDRVNGPQVPGFVTTATVDGVRIVNGSPMLSIADQDVEPSQIARIR